MSNLIDKKEKLENYLAEMLLALGASPNSTAAILAMLEDDVQSEKELMDWLVEHSEDGLTESQILFTVNDLLH